LGSISRKNLRGITGETFGGYFEEDFRENIDHYILFVDINSQTNILKWNLKFILNLERVWENFRIWIFGMLHLETWQNWDVYHGMHHIGSSLLPSGLVHTLDPNFPTHD
jgi:hypothetical protein